MKMKPAKPTISLTGIIVKDKENNGYTTWFAEFPEAIAEGRTEEEAKENLIESLQIILEMKKEEDPIKEPHHLFKTTSFDFELA